LIANVVLPNDILEKCWAMKTGFLIREGLCTKIFNKGARRAEPKFIY